LADAGLPSQVRHPGPTNRPHITLTVASAVTASGEERLRVSLPARLPVPVRLGALVCFGSKGGSRQVLARIVVPNPELLELQAEAARVFAELPGTSPQLQPGGWTAHVTLGMHLRPEQVGPALVALGEVSELTGQASGVRRWDSAARRDWLLE
jgi:hypothetical protein